MKKEVTTILISLNWAFDEIEANITMFQKQKAIEFIKKLLKDFDIRLVCNENEIMAAKWLVDNDASCLVECLVNDTKNCPIYLNDNCIKSCKDFDELYKRIIAFKT